MNLQKAVFVNKLATQKYPLLITLVFFLVISYIAFFQNDYIKDGDFFHYYLYGKQVLAGNGSNVASLNAPLGGPVLYTVLDSFFKDPFFTAKIISLFSGTAIVFFSYYTIKNIFDSKVALIGQLFVAFNPRLDIVSLQALNELFPIALIVISFFFITKKNLKLIDITIIGLLLGIAFTIRYQSILIFFSFIVFLIIRKNKIRMNLYRSLTLVLFFLIAFSPLMIYNYSTYGKFIDSNANFELIMKSKYKNPYWIDEMTRLVVKELPTNPFVDINLFVKNYFYNLFFHNPNKLFNFGTISNVSIIPTIPFIGIIPVIGGLVYLLHPKLDKQNIIVLSSSLTITTLIVFLLGDINIHFFVIIIIPLLSLALLNIRNVSENLLPLLISPVIFLTLISIFALSKPDHLFPFWIVIPTLSAIFFVKTLPNFYLKIKSYKQLQSATINTKFITILIVIILLLNLAHSYKSIENYLYKETYNGIINEFFELFKQKELTQRGYSIKEIGDILSKQPQIENSYVMTPTDTYLYYVNTKVIMTTFQEGERDDSISDFITRKNWSDFDLYMSNINSYPNDRHDLYKPIPDYLIFGELPIQPWKYDINKTQYEDLKILADPHNPKIPSNFELIYKSNKTDVVIYKIDHTKQGN